ncbi:serine protease, S1-C subfamily, contains C-terminal PDZ domain [Rubritalea squalenifaciens DSM 18772]|uniref:Serine protease, S1-C subfamily, contains C-terminal PDZ domain n=1 Tax=Rubritalea squalenifaciens DSM 18772 TaxID=1123071 RepID=A0A1M6I443_9BACT|nr:PDZ domain-containing protein [Rubritalea squalenifaciens]SHJ29241.1 serine protease, S1-C subfamily, contains C-terminal PDZ domain [Rubritalea squalenifaciens DSM 18772]
MFRQFILSGVAVAASTLTLLGQALDLEFTHAEGMEKGKSPAKGVLIDDEGTLATVAVYGTDPHKAFWVDSTGKEVALTLLAHDEVSRITLLKVPKPVSEGKKVVKQMGESSDLVPAAALTTDLETKGGVSRLVSKVKRFDGKVLPLTLMRVAHTKEGVMPGTPLFDEKGDLVGLAHEAVVSQKSNTYALPVEALKHILAISNDAGKDKEGVVKRCWVGLALDAQSDSPVVTGVRPESPARKAGIIKGDIILSVAGENVAEYADVVDSFYYMQPKKAVTFKVLRGTEVKEFSVVPEVNPLFKE